MRILVACEESQAVTIELRKLGHEAYSCDLLECSGGHPEWHIQGDVLKQFDNGWDMMLSFPPCTNIASSGAAWFEKKRLDGRHYEGIDFFMRFTQTDIPKVAIENPVGVMSREYRKPDQIIQPYFFGDEFQKTTCLWLKNLPPLQHYDEDDLFYKKTHVSKGEMVEFVNKETGGKTVMPKWYSDLRGKGKLRSKTFPGIARAMAEQWTNNRT